MRASGAPVRALRHIERAGQDHHRLLETVFAQQAGEGSHALKQSLIVFAGGAQAVKRARVGRGCQLVLQPLARVPGGRGQQIEQAIFTFFSQALLQPGQGNLYALVRIFRTFDRQTKQGFACPASRVVEQALVDVADLLDIQRAKRETPRLHAARTSHLKVLQREEQVQHRAVIDGQRLGLNLKPVRALRATLQKGKAVGIKEVAIVGAQAQVLVADSAVDHTKQAEQARPGIVLLLKKSLVALAGHLLQLRQQGRGGIVLVIETLAQRQQIAFLGEE